MSDRTLTELRAVYNALLGRVDSPMLAALDDLGTMQEGLSIMNWGPEDRIRTAIYQKLVEMRKELVGYRVVTEVIRKNLESAIEQREKEIGPVSGDVTGIDIDGCGTSVPTGPLEAPGGASEEPNPGDKACRDDPKPETGERQSSDSGEQKPSSGRILSTEPIDPGW